MFSLNPQFLGKLHKRRLEKYEPKQGGLEDIHLGPYARQIIYFSQVLENMGHLSGELDLFYTINPASENPDLDALFIALSKDGVLGHEIKVRGNFCGYFPENQNDFIVLINNGPEHIYFPIEYRQPGLLTGSNNSFELLNSRHGVKDIVAEF